MGLQKKVIFRNSNRKKINIEYFHFKVLYHLVLSSKSYLEYAYGISDKSLLFRILFWNWIFPNLLPYRTVKAAVLHIHTL